MAVGAAPEVVAREVWFGTLEGWFWICERVVGSKSMNSYISSIGVFPMFEGKGTRV